VLQRRLPALQRIPGDFRLSIIDPPGETAYPISSFTWMLVPSVITDPAKRTAIIKFLQWGLTKGQDYLEPLSYARLPGLPTDPLIVYQRSRW